MMQYFSLVKACGHAFYKMTLQGDMVLMIHRENVYDLTTRLLDDPVKLNKHIETISKVAPELAKIYPEACWPVVCILAREGDDPLPLVVNVPRETISTVFHSRCDAEVVQGLKKIAGIVARKLHMYSSTLCDDVLAEFDEGYPLNERFRYMDFIDLDVYAAKKDSYCADLDMSPAYFFEAVRACMPLVSNIVRNVFCSDGDGGATLESWHHRTGNNEFLHCGNEGNKMAS